MTLHHQLVPILRWLFTPGVLAPADVESRARMLLADTVACIIAGREDHAVAEYARGLAVLAPGAIPFGDGIGLAPLAFAQVAATAGTWDEACEGLPRAHGRPGVPVIGALLGLAHARELSLGATLEAIVAGYEVGGRMGEWLRNKPGMHVDAGWPSLGVAAGAARALGHSADDALSAIETVACQLPIGLYASVKAGATARNTYLAHAASLGIMAAVSSAGGIDAPENGLAELARVSFGIDASTVRLAPAGEVLLRDGYLKEFAAVKHVAYGATAALALRDRLYTRLDRIRRIELAAYPEAIMYCGNRAPSTPIAAQFSLAFGVAAALRFGELGPAVYRQPQFTEAGVRRLESLVTLVVDPELAAHSADGRRGARLTVHLDTETLDARAERVKGDPDRPFTPADSHAKFVDYARARLGADRAARAADAILEGPLDAPLAAIWRSLWPSA